MLIYHHELSLADGFTVLHRDKPHRLIRGKPISACSGWALFKSLEGQPIKCWSCGTTADRWIADKGRADHAGLPVLNLYGQWKGILSLITRDHIIPRSLGGSDHIDNLRPACAHCNGLRGNQLTDEDLVFRAANPHLILPHRLEQSWARTRVAVTRVAHQGERDKLLAPYLAIGLKV